MNTRLKRIRKSLGLSQEKFGEKIGLKKNSLSQLENGVNTITDRIINDVCREFYISPEWLRYGTGEMHIQSNDKLSMYVSEITDGDDDFIKDLIEVYMELDQSSKDALKEIAYKMADKRNGRER